MTIKEIRVKSGISQTAAAALAACSPTTWRLFEANPEAVRPELRAKCEAAVAQLRGSMGTAA